MKAPHSDAIANAARLLMLALAAMICAHASALSSNVVAHASDSTLWLGQVQPAPELKPGGEKTMLRFRPLNAADQAWRELPTLAGRVVQIASRADSAALLMDDGQWLLLWSDGSSTGPALPDHFRMIALASDRDTLYAIGAPPPPSPTTEQSNLSSLAPATTQAAQSDIALDQPILFTFAGTQWKAVANCPPNLSLVPGDISLSVQDRSPMLAQAAAGTRIGVWQLDSNQKWQDVGTITPPAEAQKNPHLLSDTQRPMLWLPAANSGGLLYSGGEKWQPPIKLALSRSLPLNNSCLIFAAGTLRLFAADERGKLLEQRYDSNGTRVGDLAPLETPEPLFPDTYSNWPMIAIVAALAFLMLTSARRRGADERDTAQPGVIVIAAAGQRLLAGLIDASPLILCMIYLAGNFRALQEQDSVDSSIPIVIAMAIYLLHTTLSELLTHRTLGKMFIGLRVVSADNSPAKAGAILIRNLLRVIDIFPVPLGFLIAFSPTRQRLGDHLAGTIVIVEPRSQEEDEKDE